MNHRNKMLIINNAWSATSASCNRCNAYAKTLRQSTRGRVAKDGNLHHNKFRGQDSPVVVLRLNGRCKSYVSSVFRLLSTYSASSFRFESTAVKRSVVESSVSASSASDPSQMCILQVIIAHWLTLAHPPCTTSSRNSRSTFQLQLGRVLWTEVLAGF